MKNFLQICQDVYREGGIAGYITSTQNQSGEPLRVVEWVKGAYREILNSDQFSMNFLRKSSIVQLTAGIAEYSKVDLGLATLGQWDTRTMRVAANANLSDETFLINMRYPEFRDQWLFSTRAQVTSRPLNCTVTPDTKLRIAPIPERDYYLNLQWIDAPVDLAEDGDVPVIPDRWIAAIMWRALRHYGLFEAAPEVVMRADSAYNEIMLRLTLDQSPEVVVGPPLC
jgi:hypothetical protein